MKSRVKGAACHSWIALFSYVASNRVSPPTSLLHDASCKYCSKLHAGYTLLPLPKTTFSLALPFTWPQRRSLSDSFSNVSGTVGSTVATRGPFLEYLFHRQVPIFAVTVMSRTHGTASYCSPTCHPEADSAASYFIVTLERATAVPFLRFWLLCAPRWNPLRLLAIFSELMLTVFNSSHRPSSLLLRFSGGFP
jgi:hypothetical protein